MLFPKFLVVRTIEPGEVRPCHPTAIPRFFIFDIYPRNGMAESHGTQSKKDHRNMAIRVPESPRSRSPEKKAVRETLFPRRETLRLREGPSDVHFACCLFVWMGGNEEAPPSGTGGAIFRWGWAREGPESLLPNSRLAAFPLVGTDGMDGRAGGVKIFRGSWPVIRLWPWPCGNYGDVRPPNGRRR